MSDFVLPPVIVDHDGAIARRSQDAVALLPRRAAAVIMATAFDDLLESGRWLPALDKLAAGVGLEPETGPANEEVR
jgi:hypothetical protein